MSFNVNVLNRLPSYRHNTGPICSFYNQQGTSAISLSFNKDVSQNKLMKSVSIEGTNNIDGGVILSANPTTTGNTVSNVAPFTEHGGIQYGIIQGRQDSHSGTTHLVGRVLQAQGTSGVMKIEFVEGGKTGLSSSDSTAPTKLFFYDTTNDSFFAQGLTPVDPAAPYATILGYTISEVGTNTIRTAGAIDFPTAASLNSGNVYVYSITGPTVNGGMLHGQYADISLILGSNPYELFAINMEYEPMTYDHYTRATPGQLPSA